MTHALHVQAEVIVFVKRPGVSRDTAEFGVGDVVDEFSERFACFSHTSDDLSTMSTVQYRVLKIQEGAYEEWFRSLSEG